MITLRGVALVATAVFVYILARLTQVGWLYLLDAMIWGSIILSLILPLLATTSLSARRRLLRPQGRPGSPGPAQGETVQLELTLENRRAWPRHLLSLSYQCPLAAPEGRRRGHFVSRLDGHGSLALVGSVTCRRRGLHLLGPVTVESRAPFGLFRWRTRLDAPLSVLVYPELHPMERLGLMEEAQGTAARPKRTRVGQEVSGSRRYFPGDPMRNVHWRNTARLGYPMVKEYEDTQENVLTIVFDSSLDLGVEPDTLVEFCVKLAASVAAHVTAQGGRVRLLTGGLPGQERPWPVLYRDLALLEPGRGPGLASLLEGVPATSPVLALVSEGDRQGIDALARHRRRGADSAVVLLEGFGAQAGEHPHSGSEGPALAALPLVHGRPGSLLQTLGALEAMRWQGRPDGLRAPAGHHSGAAG